MCHENWPEILIRIFGGKFPLQKKNIIQYWKGWQNLKLPRRLGKRSDFRQWFGSGSAELRLVTGQRWGRWLLRPGPVICEKMLGKLNEDIFGMICAGRAWHGCVHVGFTVLPRTWWEKFASQKSRAKAGIAILPMWREVFVFANALCGQCFPKDSEGLVSYFIMVFACICMIEFVMCVGAHPNVQFVVSTFEWAQVLYRLAKYHGMIGGTISLI